MGTISKATTIILTIIIVTSSLLLIPLVNAQTIPKPSVPEFTVGLVKNPYCVPQSKTTDPYTGAVTTYPGYTEENRSIEITIKNQPYTSTKMTDGNWSRLYYDIRFKGHFYVGDWSYYPVKAGAASEGGYIAASNSDYTTIALPKYLSLKAQQNGSQTDFQVQALIGYDETIYRVAGNTGELSIFGTYFTGEVSDWSPTQTLSIPDGSVSTTSPSPTMPNFGPTSSPTPTNPNGNLISVPLDTLSVVVAVFLAIITAL